MADQLQENKNQLIAKQKKSRNTKMSDSYALKNINKLV